jgi:biotin operon repressor
MIGLMVDERRCGRELASELGVSAPTVSHHLQILRRAGLVSETRENPYTFYKLDLAALQTQVKRVADKRQVQKLAAGDGLAEEKRRVLANFFDGDSLKRIPAQRRKKEIVFEEILRRIPRQEVYTERELSKMLKAIHSDFCTIRREFIMGKYMDRERSSYRLTNRGRAVLAE